MKQGEKGPGLFLRLVVVVVVASPCTSSTVSAFSVSWALGATRVILLFSPPSLEGRKTGGARVVGPRCAWFDGSSVVFQSRLVVLLVALRPASITSPFFSTVYSDCHTTPLHTQDQQESRLLGA